MLLLHGFEHHKHNAHSAGNQARNETGDGADPRGTAVNKPDVRAFSPCVPIFENRAGLDNWDRCASLPTFQLVGVAQKFLGYIVECLARETRQLRPGVYSPRLLLEAHVDSVLFLVLTAMRDCYADRASIHEREFADRGDDTFEITRVLRPVRCVVATAHFNRKPRGEMPQKVGMERLGVAEVSRAFQGASNQTTFVFDSVSPVRILGCFARPGEETVRPFLDRFRCPAPPISRHAYRPSSMKDARCGNSGRDTRNEKPMSTQILVGAS